MRSLRNGEGPVKRTFFSSCGSGVNTRQTSRAVRPCSTITASTCKAANKPSPVVAKSDRITWPDCSPPRFMPTSRIALGDVAIARPGAVQRQSVPGQESLQTEVGHHGGDDAVAAQPAAGGPGLRDQRQDLVAVDQFARLVRHQQPIGVAVERDAEMRAMLDHLRA